MLQPRHGSVKPIARGFRHLRHGDVHYRTAGDGPVVLALHESPRSSLSLLPVIEALSHRFQVIAPDTPGYGLSDPLSVEAPEMEDFLDAIADLLDDMGLKRVALYGAHTGAALATAFAARNPERVTAMVLDGLSAFTADEVEAFHTRYLTPYEPHWDGRHVAGLWSRVKDLYTWFPWYEQTPERRLGGEPAGLEPLERSALGFLQAGAHYTKAYRLAAAFQPNSVIQDLRSPTSVVARPDDLIADHLARLTPGPSWDIRWLDERESSWRDALLDGLAAGPSPDRWSPTPAPQPQAICGSHFLPMGRGWLHVRMAGPAEGPVRAALPALPGDVTGLVDRLTRSHPGDRLAILSPPGCGWSDPLADAAAGLDGVLDVLDEALAQLDIEPSVLAGEGASALIAALWARRRGRPSLVEQIDPPAWLASPQALPRSPPLCARSPSWDGAHFTAAWFQLRDLQLYDVPPGSGTPVRRAGAARPDVERLDRLFRSYVEGPDCAGLLAAVIEHLRRHPDDHRIMEDR